MDFIIVLKYGLSVMFKTEKCTHALIQMLRNKTMGFNRDHNLINHILPVSLGHFLRNVT